MSGTTTQRLAAAGRRSGAGDVADFSSTGHHGQAAGNIARDLMRRILTALYWVEVPLHDPAAAPGSSRTRTVAYPFLLPHEVLAHLVGSSEWQVPVATQQRTPHLYQWVKQM